ncbi:MAG TPA: hypothetical protein VMS89_07270 [Methanoregulaceae archaeon]|nr:hypothetical protein [Methanoregulaceae archaeon]
MVDEPVPGNIITYLEQFGSVKVLADMAQPFYTFRMADYFNIKGMVDDTTMFVRYQPEFMPHTEILFTHLISGFDTGNSDLESIREQHDELIRKITSAASEIP